MKILQLIFLFILVSTNANSINIRVIEIELLVNENSYFKNLISKIENDQTNFRSEFKNKESELKKKIKEIDELKLILEPNELEEKIKQYNKELNEFNLNIKKFNTHYENQLNISRNIIVQNILKLIKDYASENNIDLILDENNYIISSNSINITKNILEQLNNIELNLTFEKFE